MNNLAACVQQPEHFIVIFQAGGQGQLHVSTHARCNTDNSQSQLRRALQATKNTLFIVIKVS